VIALVHLVWAPLGPEPLRRFLRSYRGHPAGAAHELIILLNGSDPRASGGSAVDRGTLLAELDGLDHRLIVLERPVLDLAAYGEAAAQLEHATICLLNSYSVIQVDGWLSHLAQALQIPDVGLAGASASWESQAEWIRGPLVYWLPQLALLRRARSDYPRFPNPHIRTNAFMLERLTLAQMALERATDKRAAYLLESGHQSITRQVLERGLRTVVVGRSGGVYDVEDWPASHTFRSGGQENLLVADNRTDDWINASVRLRRRLSRDAWGRFDA
jgi:hypothetical protein